MLRAESVQTHEMMGIYTRFVAGEATKAEIERANKQFGDLLRLAGLGTFFAIVPGSALLLPVAVLAAKKLGIELLPDSWEPPLAQGTSGNPSSGDGSTPR